MSHPVDPSEPRRRARRGMTLVEILAVVVILGLIATTLVFSFRGQVGRAKRELARTGVSVVVSAIETFAVEQGRIPTSQEGLGVLTQAPQGRGEPYIRPDKLSDPWGNAYQYAAPGPSGTGYLVLSLGADGRVGGATGTEEEDVTSDALTRPAPGSGAPSGGGGGR